MKVTLPLDKKAVSEIPTMQGVLDLLGAVNAENGINIRDSEIIGFDAYFEKSKLCNAALDMLHEEINRRSAGVKRSHDLVLMAEKATAVVQ